MTLPAQDFPRFVPPEDAVSFTAPVNALSRLIEATHIAQGDEVTRPILAGVHLHRHAAALRGVALNGHYMIRAEVPAPQGSEDLPPITLSTKTVALLRKLLAKGQGEARITASSGKVHFEIGPAQLLAKLLEGDYPDYTRMIPDGGEHRLSGQRDVLIGAASAAMAVVEADSKSIRAIKATLAKDAEPEFSARDTMGSSSVEPVDGGYEGDGLIIGINGRYLQQVASVFAESSSVDLTMIDAQKAIVFTAANEPDLLAICMPLRV
jgi:DNA polymerase-3 subunit beta